MRIGFFIPSYGIFIFNVPSGSTSTLSFNSFTSYTFFTSCVSSMNSFASSVISDCFVSVTSSTFNAKFGKNGVPSGFSILIPLSSNSVFCSISIVSNKNPSLFPSLLGFHSVISIMFSSGIPSPSLSILTSGLPSPLLSILTSGI